MRRILSLVLKWFFRTCRNLPLIRTSSCSFRTCKKIQKTGSPIIFFAENPKQLERFYNIFEDLDAEVQWHAIPVGLHQGFLDYDLKFAIYTDHQIFDRYHKYKVREGFDKNTSLKIKALSELKPGDYVTHIDHGVGRYGGLEKIDLQGKQQEAVKLVYKDNDILYVSIQSLHKISKFTGKDGTAPKIHKLGSNAWGKYEEKSQNQNQRVGL